MATISWQRVSTWSWGSESEFDSGRNTHEAEPIVNQPILVRINGEKREIACEQTIDNLLLDLELALDQVAVEVNREIVRRNEWGTRVLRQDDQIEIVHFVGGGETNYV